MIVTLENITKYFGDKNVLTDVNATVEATDKIGVIGPNGAGKTTLVNMICGLLPPDAGKVMVHTGSKIGFLQQNSGVEGNNTILQEARTAFSELLEVETKMKELEQLMSHVVDAELDKISKQYARLSTFYEQQGGYTIDVEIKKVLNGMGFEDKDMNTLVSTLSGGEKTRLALGKLLLEQPDLLILDEPTNHLDFAAIEWLEMYLAEYKKAMLIVSHDRYFLDKTVNAIWEIERTKLTAFKGNYSKYTLLKEEAVTRQLKEYEQQQAKIADMEEFVAKNIVRASTTKRAQSRRKELDKLERIEKPILHQKHAKLSFTFEQETGNDVLQVEDLTLQVEDTTLCAGICFELKRGDKLGIIGVNGAGKSTLLKTLHGDLQPSFGRIVWGRNVVRGYYDQEHLSLNPANSVLEELWSRFPRLAEQQVRNALGAVGLTGDNVLKKVGVLSGGEKAKLLFAILSASHPNVMLLDEPTNHLDLSTKEVLEKALMEYPGTIIVVSHDRYFLSRVPEKIGHLDRNGLIITEGNYEAYKASLAKPKPAEPEIAKPKQESAGYRSKEEKRQEAQTRQRVRELEAQLEQLETDIERLSAEIAMPEIASDYQLLQEKCAQLEEQKTTLNGCYEEWMSLQS